MVQSRLLNYWLLQIVAILSISVFFLLANIVPRAVVHPLVSNDGERAPYSHGEMRYGWSKTSHVIEITQKMNSERYLNPGYSIRHFLEIEEFKLATIQRSEFAVIANFQIFVSVLMMVGIGFHFSLRRQYSIRLLMVTIICVAFATSSILWNCSL